MSQWENLTINDLLKCREIRRIILFMKKFFKKIILKFLKFFSNSSQVEKVVFKGLKISSHCFEVHFATIVNLWLYHLQIFTRWKSKIHPTLMHSTDKLRSNTKNIIEFIELHGCASTYIYSPTGFDSWKKNSMKNRI